MREQHLDVKQQKHYVETHLKLLITDQKNAYNKIMQRVTKNQAGLLFLDAPEGIGKTFLIHLILASVRK